MYKTVTAEEALKVVKSNDKIYVQAAAAAPTLLVKALADRHEELRNVEICQLHTEGEAPYANPEYAESFHVNSFFIGKNVRHTLHAGNGSYTPVFLSEVPLLFKRNIVDLQVALIHVSVPDKHGYCSLGVSVEATLAAIDNADYVIAQVNKQMPRTHGAGIIHHTEMSAYELRDALVPELQKGDVDFVCLNFANGDMVGHTGVMEAAIKACEAVDECVKDVVTTALENNYTTILIADHGNCETMINPDGTPNTAHTTNPVPVILIDKDLKEIKDGILGDIAPTVLKLIGIPQPEAMTQHSLV